MAANASKMSDRKYTTPKTRTAAKDLFMQQVQGVGMASRLGEISILMRGNSLAVCNLCRPSVAHAHCTNVIRYTKLIRHTKRCQRTRVSSQPELVRHLPFCASAASCTQHVCAQMSCIIRARRFSHLQLVFTMTYFT